VAQLNGWQRLWIVVSGFWIIPVLILGGIWVSDGGLRVYSPPPMERWELICSVDNLVGAARGRYSSAYKDLSDSDLRSKIEAQYSEGSTIEFWVPKGVDGTAIRNLSCEDASMVVHPETNREQLAVLVTLDSYYPTWHKGHDFDSAITDVTKERIARSKRERRETLLVGTAAALVPPMLLYALGFAVAWVRHGFRQKP
jgi:hypothetical protein